MEDSRSSSKWLLIMIGSVAVLFLVMTLFLATERPEGDEDAGAVRAAPEQQVESEDTDMPVTPHNDSPYLEQNEGAGEESQDLREAPAP